LSVGSSLAVLIEWELYSSLAELKERTCSPCVFLQKSLSDSMETRSVGRLSIELISRRCACTAARSACACCW